MQSRRGVRTCPRGRVGAFEALYHEREVNRDREREPAASAGGLDNFRAGTRTLLGEYTDHFKRQRIVDQSREELKLEGSLGNAVHCSRLDRVKVTPGQVPVMELM